MKYDFLEAGDVLEASGYEVEGLHKANHDFGEEDWASEDKYLFVMPKRE